METEPVRASSAPIVRMEGACLRYGRAEPWAVEDFHLDLREGEILTLLGPSGCGKTSILRLIAGFETPERGRIFIAGKRVAGDSAWSPPERRGVGMVFQDLALFPQLTVEKNVGFGLRRWAAEQRRARVSEVLKMVNLLELRDRYPHELSGGQQQRVALARALAPSPLVILFDEPFSSLDADMRRHVRWEVREILRRSKQTAIFVTHDQEEAFDLSDRIAVMNVGRIEQLDSPENIYHDPQTRFVARFLGQTDLIPGVIRQNRVETELGRFFYVPGDIPYEEGLPVEVVLRPADVDIIPSPEGEATVIARHFRGSDNLYTISLPSGGSVRSQTPWDFILALGTRVAITVEPIRVVAFPALSKDENARSDRPAGGPAPS
ncbi:MAG: ABC transporter ATP-binding protein [Candidatus Tectomicrobia bacterium]|nr:ABC transporter ATP-binding protein [Candidatus Tectomicrobia bacterium]